MYDRDCICHHFHLCCSLFAHSDQKTILQRSSLFFYDHSCITPDHLYWCCLRSPKDTVRVNKMIAEDRSGIEQEELPRMETVMRNFKMIKWIEIVLMIAGLILFCQCRLDRFGRALVWVWVFRLH